MVDSTAIFSFSVEKTDLISSLFSYCSEILSLSFFNLFFTTSANSVAFWLGLTLNGVQMDLPQYWNDAEIEKWLSENDWNKRMTNDLTKMIDFIFDLRNYFKSKTNRLSLDEAYV